jgi:hypothetical protein
MGHPENMAYESNGKRGYFAVASAGDGRLSRFGAATLKVREKTRAT